MKQITVLHNFLKCLLWGTCVFFMFSCEQGTPWEIAVKVRDHTGEKISGAEIQLSGTPLGVSDQQGSFKKTLSLQPGVRGRLEVFYEKPLHHYSPYLKTFVVPKEQQTGNTTLHFEAVLYAMPKKKPATSKAPLTTTSPNLPTTSTTFQSSGELPTPKPAFSTHRSLLEEIPALATTAPKPPPTSQNPPPIQTAPKPGDEQAPDSAPSPKTPAPQKTSKPTPPAEIPPSTEQKEIEKPKSSPPKTPPSRPKPQETATTENTLSTLAQKTWVVETLATSQKNSPYLGGVEVLVAAGGTIHRWCVTSPQGYCARQVMKGIKSRVEFIARKAGYQSTVRKVLWTPKGRVSLRLSAGTSLDVFAFKPGFFALKGWPMMEIAVNGQPLGVSSEAGFFTTKLPLPTVSSPELNVELSHPNAVPAKRSIKHHESSSEAVVALFEPRQAPKLATVLLRPSYQPRRYNDQPPSTMMSHIARISKNHLFRHPMVHRIGWSFSAHTSPTLSLVELKERGWRSQELGLHADAMVSWYLYPTETPSSPSYLEAQLTLAPGTIQGAVSTPVDLAPNHQAPYWNHLIGQQMRQLRSWFPYQGTILALSPSAVTVNLGSRHDLKVGSILEVRSLRAQWKKSRFITELPGKRGHIRLTKIKENSSVGVLEGDGARVSQGDKVIFWGTHASTPHKDPYTTPPLRVVDATQKQPLPGVTAFTVENPPRWLGATDLKGVLYWREHHGDSLEGVKVVLRKVGYSSVTLAWQTLKRGSQTPLALTKRYQALHIASQPPGREVQLEGKIVGITPLSYMIPARQDISLTIKAPEGYEDFHRTLQAASPSAFDFTAPRTITFIKDPIAEIMASLTQAEKNLRDHLKAPQKSKLSAEEVSSHWLKAGMLSFQLAEAAGKRQKTQKSITAYQRTAKYLKKALDAPQNNTQRLRSAYYQALSWHRIALLQKDAALLRRASTLWQKYLKMAPQSPWPSALPQERYLSQAQAYAKEAQTDLKNLSF